MKKCTEKIIIVILSICVVVLGVMCFLNPETKTQEVVLKTKIFTNNVHGFEMTVPTTWEEGGKIEGIDFALYDSTKDDFRFILAKQFILDKSQGYTFADIVEDNKDVLLGGVASSTISLLSESDVVVDGREAKLLKTKSVEGRDAYIDYTLFVNNDDKIVMVVGSYKEDWAVTYDKVVLDSLLSFKVIK